MPIKISHESFTGNLENINELTVTSEINSGLNDNVLLDDISWESSLKDVQTSVNETLSA